MQFAICNLQPEVTLDKFKEYELFTAKAERMSDRRQTTTQMYLTVNTAILGVAAFLIKDTSFRGWSLVLACLPLVLVGIMACIVWHKIIADFRQIIGWHYEQLRDMEGAMPGSQQIYTNEWNHFFKPQRGRERYGFSRLEAWLPRMFIGLYVVYFVAMTAATAFGLL
jgi:uncharacterized membrane protein